MTYDASLLNYFLHASIVVKGVLLLLASASIFSWTCILQRLFYLNDIRQATRQFEVEFWSGKELAQLHARTSLHAVKGLAAVFSAGFKEFIRFRTQAGISLVTVIENTKRAMCAAQMREQDKLETHLSFLAIVASTSPYIGLLGTVWGMMQALRALANVQQATISMVAPGIAEALIATALGLFAAIPAVIAYNRFTTEIGRLLHRFDAFQEEFINILARQSQSSATSAEMAEE
jgi:biopolymer transport protein TolQ